MTMIFAFLNNDFAVPSNSNGDFPFLWLYTNLTWPFYVDILSVILFLVSIRTLALI
jgi:hypothetical protein